MIKLIVSDMDGTLVNDEKKIDDIAVGLTLGFLILTAVVCLDAADKLEMILYQYETYQQFRFYRF